MNGDKVNVDRHVAEGFGREWTAFRQRDHELLESERAGIFNDYFRVFPWEKLPASGGIGADIGCGTGRWSKIMASRVAHLHVLDVSTHALAVARKNLAGEKNVSFHLASVDAIPLPERSLDFAFSLGVLHHVPDTKAAIRSIGAKLKPGAPLLLYLYYSFDNRPAWYRWLWKATDALRVVLSRCPHWLQLAASSLIAILIYWPIARLAALLEKLGLSAHSLPLSYYRDKSLYVLRTDAYDRFCTRLEKRFSKTEIDVMLRGAGFREIRFSEHEPYWCVVGTKA